MEAPFWDLGPTQRGVRTSFVKREEAALLPLFRQEKKVKTANKSQEPRKLPRYALVPGKGKCSVKGYHGRNIFTIVVNGKVVYIHRDDLIKLTDK